MLRKRTTLFNTYLLLRVTLSLFYRKERVTLRFPLQIFFEEKFFPFLLKPKRVIQGRVAVGKGFIIIKRKGGIVGDFKFISSISKSKEAWFGGETLRILLDRGFFSSPDLEFLRLEGGAHLGRRGAPSLSKNWH